MPFREKTNMKVTSTGQLLRKIITPRCSSVLFFPTFFFSSLSTTLVNGHILALTLTGWLPCSIQPFIYLPIYSGKGPRKVKRNKPRIFDIERDSGIYEGSSFAVSSFRRTSRSTSIYLCNTSNKDVMEQVPVPPREKGGFHFILTERTFNPGFFYCMCETKRLKSDQTSRMHDLPSIQVIQFNNLPHIFHDASGTRAAVLRSFTILPTVVN